MFPAKFAKNTFYTEQQTVATFVYRLKALTISWKGSILDAWQGPKYASGDYSNKRLFKTLKFWCSSIQKLNVFLKCDSIYY